jgi:hypothetical protein
MRDGGELPIRRVLIPDHHKEDHATHNLAERRKGRKSVRLGGKYKGKRKRRTLEK